MGILSTSWEWLIYESHTSGNCWIEKSFCLLFVYLTSKAALVLNPALLDMSASTHSDNLMNINYNNANNNDNGEWRGEKSCQFSNGHWQSLTRTSVCWKKKCVYIYTHIHIHLYIHTNEMFHDLCHFLIFGWSLFFGEGYINSSSISIIA